MPDSIEKGMDANDKQRLFLTLEAHTDTLKAQTKMMDEQTKTLSELKSGLAKVNRGVYGDIENGVKGILKDVAEIKAWIMSANLKVARITGMVMVAVFAIKFVWDWLQTKLKP